MAGSDAGLRLFPTVAGRCSCSCSAAGAVGAKRGSWRSECEPQPRQLRIRERCGRRVRSRAQQRHLWQRTELRHKHPALRIWRDQSPELWIVWRLSSQLWLVRGCCSHSNIRLQQYRLINAARQRIKRARDSDSLQPGAVIWELAAEQRLRYPSCWTGLIPPLPARPTDSAATFR